ncbi:DUF1543 domain-containing protein [Mucilaginibacter aquaedulcis]|uniref:DUF1543 domain-containing protein n=1 Tax=Mucilaginibacter aquaedulcis TaxID=1187081 RepID=UPI0025B394B3|nr:DUF1543 domain-containing protein [Mucilaginibacter aquaedulcis]MDN3550835.1 DUF1543 domain-containing protein [Mucilaginibacter aquaedulcis]
MATLKLFMMMLGGKPAGRHTEQHDIFFGIGESPKSLVNEINSFWPEAKGKLHVDAWREVTSVNGCRVEVIVKAGGVNVVNQQKLFFINLGGYQEGLFDEPHFKVITAQPDKAKAIAYAKSTVFYREVHFPGAESHIDDKYGIDVDDLYEIEEILPNDQKQKYALQIAPANTELPEDQIHLGYFKLNALP